MLSGADVAILMTAAPSSENGGMAYNGPLLKTGSPPLAWVALVPDALTGAISFAHELGHLFGCRHNRQGAVGQFIEGSGIDEVFSLLAAPSCGQKQHRTDREVEPSGFGRDTGFGYRARGDNYHTVMAYPTPTHNRWIPYFSSAYLKYRGAPLGNAWSDNRATLMENRFLVSMTGGGGGGGERSLLRLLHKNPWPTGSAPPYHCFPRGDMSSRQPWDHFLLLHNMPTLPRC